MSKNSELSVKITKMKKTFVIMPLLVL